jgi:hypothetical protein
MALAIARTLRATARPPRWRPVAVQSIGSNGFIFEAEKRRETAPTFLGI